MKDINIIETVSKTVRVDNSADEARTHDITATVSVSTDGSGLRVDNILNATIRAVDGTVQPASFNTYAGGPLCVDFPPGCDRAALLAAIEAFIESVQQQPENL